MTFDDRDIASVHAGSDDGWSPTIGRQVQRWPMDDVREAPMNASAVDGFA
jgi:hypothetical protein